MAIRSWAICLLLLAGAARGQSSTVASPITYSVNDEPTLSPDGKRMIFVKLLEGHEQLFISNSDGTDERQLTHDSVDIEDPAWSPDGSRVAFVRTRPGGNGLYVMRLDGSALKRLTPASQSPIHPAWMPDGTAILYCTDDDLRPPLKNSAAIYRLDLATGRISTVISGGVNTYPVPSPDGKKIAFRKFFENNSEVFVASIDGTAMHNLTNHPAFDGWPAWSPDGRRIAFSSNRNSSYQIFVMDADGSNVRLVANTEGRATNPKWSPDGRSIYFPNCWRTGLRGACEIYVAPSP
jgi:TolB protein